jgi:hypothetical protein
VLFLAGCMHMPGQLPSTCFHIAINSVRFLGCDSGVDDSSILLGCDTG